MKILWKDDETKYVLAKTTDCWIVGPLQMRKEKDGKIVPSVHPAHYYSNLVHAIRDLCDHIASAKATDLQDWLAEYRRVSNQLAKIVDEALEISKTGK